ncbi:MAG: hypothetical protein IPI67_35090 [Myxococcales bacterium]|nr:hypothetical protein [Myxococcales bacterium]
MRGSGASFDLMSRPCEVCENLPKPATPVDAPAQPRIRRVLIGERIVALCTQHADQLRRSGARDVDDLRQVFSEGDGKRSLVGRRSPLDRRVFPPRPEGRRRGDGRRADDAIE